MNIFLEIFPLCIFVISCYFFCVIFLISRRVNMFIIESEIKFKLKQQQQKQTKKAQAKSYTSYTCRNEFEFVYSEIKNIYTLKAVK